MTRRCLSGTSGQTGDCYTKIGTVDTYARGQVAYKCGNAPIACVTTIFFPLSSLYSFRLGEWTDSSRNEEVIETEWPTKKLELILLHAQDHKNFISKDQEKVQYP